MSKVICYIYLILSWFNIHAQKSNTISLELNMFNVYCLSDNDDFHHGTSFLISNHSKNFKISSGIKYFSTSFHSGSDLFYSLNKKVYDFSFFSIPFIIDKKINLCKHFDIFIGIGYEVMKINKVYVTSYYSNNTLSHETLNNYKLKSSFLLHATLSKKLSTHFALNISSSINYLMISDVNDYGSYGKNISDKFTLNNSIGIEYLF